MSEPLHLAELSYPEVEAFVARAGVKVALVPSGSTEAHGPHLPLCTDSIIAEGMAEAAAHAMREQGWHPLVFPTLHYAVTDWAASFAGSVTLAQDTARGLVLQACVGAREMGFDYVVLCNAHLEPDNIATLRAVAEAFASHTGEALVFPDVTRRKLAQQLGEEFRSGSCHAGSYETSLVLARRPELVRWPLAAALPEHFVPLHERIAAGAKDFLECGLDRAYCGNPAEASAEEGLRSYAVLARACVEQVRARIELDANT